MMPLARYFVFVGGALMALLFASDFFSPRAVADAGVHSAAAIDKSTLRIRSEQKWPERVVFDTTQPTIVAKAAEVQAAPNVQAATSAPDTQQQIAATARVRETFAQFSSPEPKKAEAVVKKKKVAKVSGQPLRLARYSVFGTNTW